MDKAKVRKGMIFAFFGGILWGISGTSGQFLMQERGFDPLTVTSIRMLIGGLLLLVVFNKERFRQVKMVLTTKEMRNSMIMFTIFGLFAIQFTYLLAINETNAGTATVLQYLGPSMIFVYFLIKERRKPVLAEALAAILAPVGTFFLATHGSFSNMVITPLGLFYGIISAVAVLTYTVLPGKLMKELDTIVVMTMSLLMAGIAMLIVRPFFLHLQPIDFLTIIGFVGMVLLGTSLGFLFYLKGVHYAGPVKASLVASVETVSAIGFGVLLLGNSLHIMDLVGFVFIIAAVFLLSLPSAQSREVTEDLHKEIS